MIQAPLTPDSMARRSRSVNDSMSSTIVSPSKEIKMNKYLREVAEDEVPDNVFLGMHLNPGATRLNVIALLFSFYIANVSLMF